MFKALIDRALPPFSTLPLFRMIEEAEGMSATNDEAQQN